jgi:hypothetical protein
VTRGERPSATGAQSQRTADGDRIDTVSWAQVTLHTDRWTAEQLFDHDVYGESGEAAGEVEDPIIGLTAT